MKRYSVKVASDLAPGDLKSRLDRHLAEAALGYRLRAAVSAGPGEVWLEVASDAVRFELERALVKAMQAEGATIKAMGWGWIISPPDEPPAEPTANDLGDPLRPVALQHEATAVYRPRLRPTVLYIGKMIVGLVGFLLLLRLFNSEGLPRELVPVLLLFLVVASVPIKSDFTPARAFTCGPEGLSVSRWFPPGTVGVRWDEVLGLDLALGVGHGKVLTRRRQLDLPLLSPAAPPGGRTLARTVVDRAQLRFVEAVPGQRANYRRFDAP